MHENLTQQEYFTGIYSGVSILPFRANKNTGTRLLHLGSGNIVIQTYIVVHHAMLQSNVMLKAAIIKQFVQYKLHRTKDNGVLLT